MQITKIFCDCCGQEFTKTPNDCFGDIDVNVMTNDSSVPKKSQREIKRFKSGDVCGVCTVKIYEFINQLKLKT